MTDTTQADVADQAAPEETTAPVEPIESTEPAESAPEAEKPEEAATSEEDTSGDDTAEEKPKKKGGFQKRIDKLVTEKYEAEIRTEQLQRELTELRSKQGEGISAPAGPEPKLEDFTTVDDFKKSHAEWAKREGYQQAKREIEQQNGQAKALTVAAELRAREDQARGKFADYDMAIAPYIPAILNNLALSQYVQHSEMGPQMAYHLAKNPGLLNELTQLHPVNAVRELTKLEAKLTAPPPPKSVTKAPDPIKPVGQSEKAPFSYEKAAMDDFVRRRNEEERKHRKG